MEEEDFTKLSIDERCSHKSWKARCHGYESAANLFRQIDDEKSPEWSKYLAIIKKAVVDSNAAAQEKGLEAALALIENCSIAGKIAGDVMQSIVQKCVAAAKAKTKELALQITLMFIEIEKQETVVEELVKGTENKNPKISSACVHILTVSLKEFGARVINVSRVLKRVPNLLEDRDRSVRDETKAFLIEAYRWLGSSLKAQLSFLKSVQLTEMEAEFEKQKDIPAKPLRLLKSQQIKMPTMTDVAPEEVTTDIEITASVPEIDPYDLLEPVDILANLPKNFYVQLEAKKWSERKEALDALEKAASAPKIEPADFLDLVKSLKKIIQKDSNVVVVAVAIKCITGLANGLKKKFHPYSAMMMSCLLEKFKEKKQNVVLALRDAVDAVFLSTNLELILEDVITFLDNKNPSVKAEVVGFLARCFAKSTPTVLNKKLLKPLIKSLVKTLMDQDQVVRDTAAQALGTAMKVTGEKAIGPFLAEVDAQKLAKIKECSDKAEVISKPPQKTSPEAKTMLEVQAIKKSVSPMDKQTTSKASPAIVHQKSPMARIGKGSLVGRTEALDKAIHLIPDELKKDLCSPGENKTQAYEKLLKYIETQDKSNIFGQTILTFLYSNEVKAESDEAQVNPGRIVVIRMLVEVSQIPEYLFHELILDVVPYLSLKDQSETANEILSIISENFTFDVLSKVLLSRDYSTTPGLWADTLNWMSNAMIKTNIILDPDFLMENAKKALNQKDVLVRNAALALIGTIHLQEGAGKISRPVSNEPESTLKSGSEPISATPLEGSSNIEKVTRDSTVKLDFKTQLPEQLVTDLSDKSWKVRSEAVLKLHFLVKEAVIVNPQLGDVADVLAARLSDSNSKTAVAAIVLVDSLATAIGPPCKQYTRVFVPPLLKLIGDPKAWIKSPAIKCVSTWYETGGFKEFFEGEMIADALRSGTPAARAEMWNFLSGRLLNIPSKSIPKDELIACLPILYANVEDRNADVRKNASDVLMGFMIHLGFNTMNTACDNIKGTSGAQVKLLIEKTRGSLPEKYLTPTKPRSAGSNCSTSSSSSTSSKQSLHKMQPGSSATITKSSKQKGNSKLVATRKKKEEEIETGALLQVNNLKNQRIIDEHKLKTLKWNFTSPRPEFVELLKDLMLAANVNKTLIFNMFHTDFRYHLRAIDCLIEDLSMSEITALTSNLDLILRWMTIRFFDTNPSVLLKGLDYLTSAFKELINVGYQMLDYEANSFIPYLILKVGDPKDTVRNSVRSLFKQISSMFPVTKQFVFVMDGVKSKNARQRSECLDQLAWLIENYGMVVCQPNPPAAIKEIAKQIADRDTTVRNAALNCVVIAYFLYGEKVKKMVGKIADKDMSLLEERIKRACKNRPVASVKPLQALSDSVPEVEDEPPEDLPEEQVEYIEEAPAVEEETCPPRLSQEGPFNLDWSMVGNIEKEIFSVDKPHVEDANLEFLKETISRPSFESIQMRSITPTLSNYSHKNAIKWEITQIGSADFDKAVESISHIDAVINSDKRCFLVGFIDLMINQLVHQLVILNQSSLPEVVTCYRANFSLLMKITTYPELCSELTEGTLRKLLQRLILLLSERRLQIVDRPEMLIRTVNTLVLRCMERSNKTSVLCALISLLHQIVDLETPSVIYKDLVAKCIWKMNRTQPQWDAELDYAIVLTRIYYFFKAYPSAWWKTQDNDLPLRTLKTTLHTMVKIRGAQVQAIAKTVPEITQDSELYVYIRKLVRHLSYGSEAQPHQTKEMPSEAPPETGMTAPKLSKEMGEQIAEIFEMVGDPAETTEGMKRLFAFKQTHPEADLTQFVSKSTPVFQQYVERGLAALEQQQIPQPIPKKNTQFIPSPGRQTKLQSVHLKETEEQDISEKPFRKDAERLWDRLQFLKEQAGLPAEGRRTLDDVLGKKDTTKVDPLVIEEEKPMKNSDEKFESLKKKLDMIKHKYEK